MAFSEYLNFTKGWKPRKQMIMFAFKISQPLWFCLPLEKLFVWLLNRYTHLYRLEGNPDFSILDKWLEELDFPNFFNLIWTSICTLLWFYKEKLINSVSLLAVFTSFIPMCSAIGGYCGKNWQLARHKAAALSLSQYYLTENSLGKSGLRREPIVLHCTMVRGGVIIRVQAMQFWVCKH